MIPMNDQRVHEAVLQCDVLREVQRNGASHFVLPPGTVHLRRRDGTLKTLDCTVAISVRCFTPRRNKLNALISPLQRVDFFWTMRDFCYALRLPYTKGWCGEIGKDLKALRIYCGPTLSSRRKVCGLMDTRTKKPIPWCQVFARVPVTLRPRDIRKFYREQAAERLRACQQMRNSG